MFATLECELFDQPGGRLTSHHQAKLTIFDYLEAFYKPTGATSPSARSYAPPSRSNTATQALRPDHGRTHPVSIKPGQLQHPDRARRRYEEFRGEVGPGYPAVIRLWDHAWEEFIPFLDYDAEIRKSARVTRSLDPEGTGQDTMSGAVEAGP